MAYQLKSRRPGFTATFLCPTAAVALTQLRRARTLDYPTITVVDGAGRTLDEADLVERVASGDGAASASLPVEPLPAS